jgi:hypothetical protein
MNQGSDMKWEKQMVVTLTFYSGSARPGLEHPPTPFGLTFKEPVAFE